MSIFTMGIDVGSTASKCVILKDGSEIVAKSLVAVGTGTSGPARAIAAVLSDAGMTRGEMDFVLATGYGRNSLDGLADMQMSELSCHAKGASFLFPEVRTVIDIGGQDVKVIEIENGQMRNFVMNDKCAAGTGRFLDVMARVLEVDVEELGDLGDRSMKEVGISSTCTVFAESEVISQLAAGTDKCDIINGIHKSVAGRVSGLCNRVGVRDMVVMTGGVAQNHGIVKALQEPVRQIAVNAGIDGSVVLEKIKNSGKVGYGFDAYKEVYCDMISSGIVDPAKVTRSALENAASVSAMVLTTEALVADKPEPPAPAAPGGGMGGMDGMY